MVAGTYFKSGASASSATQANNLRLPFTRCGGFWGDSKLPFGLLISPQNLIHRFQLLEGTLHPLRRRMHVFQIGRAHV